MILNKKAKGFTLVEIIVVLVILAILAALLVPRLTGYIEKTRNQEMIQKCNSSVKAAQATSSQAYAEGRDFSDVTTDDSIAAIEKLAEVDGDGEISDIKDENYGIVHLTYTEGDRSVTYCRNYETCPEHSELYNFTDGSGGSDEPDTPEEPENTADYFYIGGTGVKVKTSGDLDDIATYINGNTLSQHGIYRWQGNYYIFKQQSNCSSTEGNKSYVLKENAYKIDISEVKTPNKKTTKPGDIKEENGRYYVYCPGALSGSADLGYWNWKELNTES